MAQILSYRYVVDALKSAVVVALLSHEFFFGNLHKYKNNFQRQPFQKILKNSTVSFKSYLKLIISFFCLLSFSINLFAGQISFSNLSQKIILNGQQSAYVVSGANVDVTIANRLIVKTPKKITAHQITLIDSGVVRVTKVYQGENFNYFLVEFKSIENILLSLDKFRQHKSVLLVQPDILQSRKNVSAAMLGNSVDNPHQDYLEQLGITLLWKETHGSGVRIAIIDDGVDLHHPALAYVKSEFLYDTETHQLSAQPISPLDSHGTQVAGIIFAAQDNPTLQGIAPDAQLIAIRQPDTWTSNTLLAFQLAKISKADVINCSWNSQFLLEPVADVVNDLTTHGREGKGIAVIFSAGNEGVSLTQMKTEATINSAITVGAVDANGAALASSNYGESVDIYVFGAGVKSTDNQGAYHQFSGTSLSAAIVSGMAALFISKQPDIPLKQLQQKLQQASDNRLWVGSKLKNKKISQTDFSTNLSRRIQ